MRPLPQGTEVKSMRQGRVNLKESFAMVRGTEVFAEGMHISPYEQGSFSNSDPLRPKKLLLHKSEIRKLSGLVSRQGYTLIPLKVYLKDGRMKLSWACAGASTCTTSATPPPRAMRSGRWNVLFASMNRRPHGGVLVSTGVNECTVSEPRTLYRATTGKNNN